MRDPPTAIERAFQLARTGYFQNVDEVRKAMSREGYSLAQVVGGAISKQLREEIKKARSQKIH